MQKEKYEEMFVEVIEFETNDIIVTSGEGVDGGEGDIPSLP